MRVSLSLLGILAGVTSVLMLVTAFTKDGSDLQIIGAGVFLTVLVVALGLLGVIARLEEIRDGRKS